MAEYYINRIALPKENPFRELFSVAKFDGGDQPLDVYYVTWDKTRDAMQCSCPNRRRGKGTDDKHGALIRHWLMAGEPTTAMTIPVKYADL